MLHLKYKYYRLGNNYYYFKWFKLRTINTITYNYLGTMDGSIVDTCSIMVIIHIMCIQGFEKILYCKLQIISEY